MPIRRVAALTTSFVVTSALAFALAPSAGATSAGDEIEGKVTTIIADDFAGGRSTEHRVLLTANGIVPLGTDVRSAQAGEGTSVRALVRAGTASVVSTLPDAPPAAVTTSNEQHLYVVAVDDASVDGDVSLAGATSIAQRAADYWKAQSRNGIAGFDIAASAALSYDHSCSTTDASVSSSGFSALMAAAGDEFPGVNFSAPGNHLVVFSPTTCKYGYSGLAVIGSGLVSGGWVQAVGTDWGIVAHELGHNFSLGHADLRFTDPSTTATDADKVLSYWGAFGPQQLQINDFDPGALDAAYRAYLDVPGESARRKVIAWNALPATYRIAPVTSATGISSLVINDPVSGTPIYLDYRSGADDDAYTYYASTFGAVKFDEGKVLYDPGVHVTSLRGRELDTLPFPVGDGEFDAAGATGDLLSLHGGQLKVVVGALTATGADVTVSFSGRPRVTTTAKISAPSVTEGAKTRVSVAIAGSTTPTGQVTIYQDGVAIGTRTLVAGKASLVTPQALKRGTRTFTVRYAGSVAFAPASRSTKVVVKDASTVRASVRSVKAGHSATLSVKVLSTLKPTGVIKVYRGTTYVAKATIKDRRATFHLPKTWKAKTYTLKIYYSGSSTIAKSKTSLKLVIKPR